MHEASLIGSLLRQVDEIALRNGGGRVTEIRVEVGLLSGVDAVLMSEAFYRLRAATSAEHAGMIVDCVGLTYRCRSCGRRTETEELQFVCADCGGCDVEVESGDSVVLQTIALEQSAQESSP